jgi:two-component sensor histidine kinase
MLREIHHRVKNNLQIITSLIRLQKQQITDAGTIDALLDSESRIRSMALVHEKLYRSADLTSIDLTDYTRTLATHLITTYATDPKKIRLVIDIKEVFLDINRATPVGLIMNELVANALTHAFPDGRSGEITITGRRTPAGITLSVQDNGVGLPEGLDWRIAPTLGLHLVITLIRQVRGSIELNRAGGTAFEIFIPSAKEETS